MSEGVGRAQETLFVGDGLQVFFKHLLGIDDGSDLQQVELSRAVVIQIAGKLNLHRAPHLVSTIFL